MSKESVREYQRVYRSKNKGAVAGWNRAYRLRNLEKMREKDRVRNLAIGRAKYKSQKERTPWGIILSAARTRAKKIGLPCDINSEWAKSKWMGKCEITGLEFSSQYSMANPFSPSIDRIIPSLGYTQGNCRFILFGINMMKGASVGDFEINTIAKAIVKRQAEARDERWK